MGLILKGVSEKAPDEYAKLEPVLKGANELITQASLLSEVGSAFAGSGGDAWLEIGKLADGLVQKGAGKLSRDEAIGQVLGDQPALYARYEAERQTAERRMM